jgi:TonB family protein
MTSMKRRICTLISIMFAFLTPLVAQDWVPIRIVGVDYPALAIQARIAGKVSVKCILDENGRVASAEILEVSGPSKGIRELLGTAAQQNALQWLFIRSGSVTQQQPSAVIIYEFGFQVNPTSPRSQSKFILDFPLSVRVIADIPPLQITR